MKRSLHDQDKPHGRGKMEPALNACKLFEAGHRVLLNDRNRATSSAATDEVGTNETYLGLFSLSDVSAIACMVLDQHDCLDVLITNASILKPGNPRTGRVVVGQYLSLIFPNMVASTHHSAETACREPVFSGANSRRHCIYDQPQAHD